MKTLAIVGLGYVGLPLAVEFGKSRKVIGFDIDTARIAELSNKIDRTLECSESELIAAGGLSFTSDIEALRAAQIFIVTVPTPIDNANRPDFSPLESASRAIGSMMQRGSIVVFESTVYPGATEEICVPILAAQSGLRYNVDFFVGYSPERINPGDRKNRLTSIKKITSGSTPHIAGEIDQLYRSIIDAGTWPVSNIRVAEAAKVIENSQRDLNIAFVNELSIIFSRMGINTIEVLEAAGTKWNFLPFRPGLVGGHCIGVDPYYLTHKAEQLGYHPQVILAGRRINDGMARFAAHSVVKAMAKNNINIANSRIAILGVTFKDNCPDIRNSKVFDLVDELRDWGATVLIVDPWANAESVRSHYGYEMLRYEDLASLDAVVIAVAHSEFREIDLRDLRQRCRSSRPVLADLKALYSAVDVSNVGFTGFSL